MVSSRNAVVVVAVVAVDAVIVVGLHICYFLVSSLNSISRFGLFTQLSSVRWPVRVCAEHCCRMFSHFRTNYLYEYGGHDDNRQQTTTTATAVTVVAVAVTAATASQLGGKHNDITLADLISMAFDYKIVFNTIYINRRTT